MLSRRIEELHFKKKMTHKQEKKKEKK